MLSRFLTDVRGNVTITAVLMLLPLCVCAGAALDYSRLSRNQGQVQNAVDAAILSVANTNPLSRETSDLEEDIDNFLKANLPAFNYNQIQSITVTKGTAGNVTVDVDANFPTSLMKIAGYDNFEYGLEAEIKIKEQLKFEIALVLDTTGSMASNGKMSTLKSVARDFVDDMLATASETGDIKLAVVPFSQYVNVGKSHSHSSWANVPSGYSYNKWKGCVGSRSYPLNVQDQSYNTKVPTILKPSNSWWSYNNEYYYCPTPLTPLTSSQGTLNNAINAMNPDGGTYIPAGMTWGIRVLSEQTPFGEGLPYDEMEDEGMKKVIILMTDGDNTMSPSSNGKHLGQNQTTANNYTLAACSEAKNSNIDVYTISFGNLSNSTESMLQSCASSNGNYYEAHSASALKDAFQQIAGGLAGLYLSK